MQLIDIIILSYFVQMCPPGEDSLRVSNGWISKEFGFSNDQIKASLRRLNQNCLISRETKYSYISSHFNYGHRKITINFQLIQGYTDTILKQERLKKLEE